jgi:hypothetical protein
MHTQDHDRCRLDISVPPARILDNGSILDGSAFVYICCGIQDNISLRNYIVSMCEKRYSRSGLRSVHRDPLPLRGGPPYPGFLLTFDSAVQSITVRSFLPLNVKTHSWIYVSEQFAAEIAKASVATGDFWVSPETPMMPPSLPSMLMPGLPVSRARHRPSSHRLQYQPYLSSRMNPASLARPSSLGTDHPDRPLGPIRDKRRGLKKNRGGHREALSKRFDKPIWEIVMTITDEQFASCTKAQQEYITMRREKITEGTYSH